MKCLTASLGVLLIAAILFSCKKEDNPRGNIRMIFSERVDGWPLVVDSMKYTNDAGNPYMVTEVQYFISKFTLYYTNGDKFTIGDDMGIHYVDSDIPESHKWEILDKVPAGEVDSVIFIFGLDEETNQSGIFPNPPESNMFWPEMMGGGYHYMKLNGKWLDPELFLQPFNFHLGIGQTYDTSGQVTGFVQNYFRVNPFLAFNSGAARITENDTTDIRIDMHIESWFKSPNTWDFNYWGGMMMQNQEAIEKACENGQDAFSYGFGDGF